MADDVALLAADQLIEAFLRASRGEITAGLISAIWTNARRERRFCKPILISRSRW